MTDNGGLQMKWFFSWGSIGQAFFKSYDFQPVSGTG